MPTALEEVCAQAGQDDSQTGIWEEIKKETCVP